MHKTKRRKLTEADVTFTVEVEQDELEIRGNAMASGDDAADRELEDQIISQLDSGNMAAWCTVTVVARWTDPAGDTFEGTDNIGACSFLDGLHEPVAAQVEGCVDDHGMRQNALVDLQRTVDTHDRRQAGELVLEAMAAVPKTTLERWIARGFKTVVPLAKAELVRRKIG
jgi:hypothetical protein